MKLKHNGTVKLVGIKPEIMFAALLLEPVYLKYELEMVITGGCELFDKDGRRIHMVGSKHEQGQALDLRSRDVPKACWTKFISDCKEALTSEYDFVVEGNHFHCEFDPD